MTTADTAKLRELALAASPSPWFAKGEGICCAVYQGTPDDQGYLIDLQDPTWADAQLIAAMRNALPALLDAADERDRLKVEQGRLGHLLGESELELVLENKRVAKLRQQRDELRAALEPFVSLSCEQSRLIPERYIIQGARVLAATAPAQTNEGA